YSEQIGRLPPGLPSRLSSEQADAVLFESTGSLRSSAQTDHVHLEPTCDRQPHESDLRPAHLHGDAAHDRSAEAATGCRRRRSDGRSQLLFRSLQQLPGQSGELGTYLRHTDTSEVGLKFTDTCAHESTFVIMATL